MLQRIGMAQALMLDPDFLFLDEPTSGLDPNGVFLVRDLIAEEKARGAAVLLNSHQLAEVEKVCDRVLFLKDGVIARDEALREIAQDHASPSRCWPARTTPRRSRRRPARSPKDNVVTTNVADRGGHRAARVADCRHRRGRHRRPPAHRRSRIDLPR